jgi:hypothetical protein
LGDLSDHVVLVSCDPLRQPRGVRLNGLNHIRPLLGPPQPECGNSGGISRQHGPYDHISTLATGP